MSTRTPTGVVYFLQAEGTDFWKIGYCRKESGVKNRISELQTGCPFKLLLRSVKTNCYQSDETWIHQTMTQWRMTGEWFRHNSWIPYWVEGWKIQ